MIVIFVYNQVLISLQSHKKMKEKSFRNKMKSENK